MSKKKDIDINDELLVVPEINSSMKVSYIETEILVEILERLRLLDSHTSRTQIDVNEMTKTIDKIFKELMERK